MIITSMSPMQIGILISVAIIFCVILGVMIYRKFHPKKKETQQQEEIIIGQVKKDDTIRNKKF